MCATAKHRKPPPLELPGLPVAKAPPMVASRTQALIDRREILAHGGRAFMENVKKMAASGMLDRQKMVDWVRIVSRFNKATGKDTSHGLLDMVHHLLADIPLGHEERLQQEDKEQFRSGDRVEAIDTKPPQLDDLACYMISRGGHGAETMFCSEAMKQLFISTDELTITVQETGLTSVSVWATFVTREGLATLNRAVSTVFFQKGTEHVEVELECLTRTGLLVVCASAVSFRVCDNGESTLILSLTVKQDAPPRPLASSIFSSRKPAVTEKRAAEGGAGMSSRTRRTTYVSERLAALASKREYEEEQNQQQQQKQSRRRRARPLDEAPLPSTMTSISPSPSTSSFSSSTSASSFSSFSSSSTPSSPFLPSSRPPPQRIAVSSKRRKTPSTVTWSQEGPPLPEAICRRITTRSTYPLSTTEDGGSYDKKDKALACTVIPEHQQQQQQMQQQQQQLEKVWRGHGKEEHNDWQGSRSPQQPRQQQQQEQQQEQQQQQQVALAPACLLPSAFSALVSLPGVPVPLIFNYNSNAETSSYNSSDASTEKEYEEQQEVQIQQQQQQVPQLKKDEKWDDIWAWANSIWEEADDMQQSPSDLGTGVGGEGIEGGMPRGVEGGVVGSVEDTSLWLMLEQEGM